MTLEFKIEQTSDGFIIAKSKIKDLYATNPKSMASLIRKTVGELFELNPDFFCFTNTIDNFVDGDVIHFDLTDLVQQKNWQ